MFCNIRIRTSEHKHQKIRTKMNTPVILLVGNGAMALVMEQYCKKVNISVFRLPSLRDLPFSPSGSECVAVHFGSGRELPQLIEYCEKCQIPIIQGSTKLDCGVLAPTTNTVMVIAPNLSLPMIRLSAVLPAFLKAVARSDMEVNILESHQAKKIDISGTARAIAKEIGVEESGIGKIRGKELSRAIGVPEEYLDGHAYHKFILSGLGATIEVSTKIHGRETYAAGAVEVAKRLLRACAPSNTLYHVGPGIHSLPSIIDRLFA